MFHEKNGKESRSLEIKIHGRPESEIKADIAARFSSGVKYPFSDSLRFSLIVGDRFLFLRNDRLEIYSDSGFDAIDGIKEAKIQEVILRYFGYDIKPLLPQKMLSMNMGKGE